MEGSTSRRIYGGGAMRRWKIATITSIPLCYQKTEI